MRTLLLHGLGQGPGDWAEVLRRLPPDGNAACPDLFAAGADYGAILRRLEADYIREGETLRLAGLSLGAVLALEMALRHPENVAELVLAAPQYKAPRGLLALQNAVFRLLPRRLFAGTGLSKEETIALCRSMRGLDLTPRLEGLACGAVILCGARDRANLPAAKALAALLPGARLHIVPEAGHALNREAPMAIAACLGA